MAITYLKRAAKTPETESGNAREVAETMLADIARRGEAAVREYAQKLDGWTGPIVLDADAIAARVRGIPAWIVMPRTASAVKKAAVIGYGGQVVECEPTLPERERVAAGAQETSRSAHETTSAVSQLRQVIDGIARGATDQAFGVR